MNTALIARELSSYTALEFFQEHVPVADARAFLRAWYEGKLSDDLAAAEAVGGWGRVWDDEDLMCTEMMEAWKAFGPYPEEKASELVEEKPRRNKRKPGPRAKKAKVVETLAVAEGLPKEARDASAKAALLAVVAQFDRVGKHPTAREAVDKVEGVPPNVLYAILHKLKEKDQLEPRFSGKTKEGNDITRFWPVPGYDGLYWKGELWTGYRIHKELNPLGKDKMTIYRQIKLGWTLPQVVLTPRYGKPEATESDLVTVLLTVLPNGANCVTKAA